MKKPTLTFGAAGHVSTGREDEVARAVGPPCPTTPLELPGAAHLLPEERVLVLAAGADPSGAPMEEAARLAARPGFDWARFFEFARVAWVHCALASSVLAERSPLRPLLPSAVADSLRLATFAARTRWQFCKRTLGPVLRGWSDEGIAVTLLKGAALQATVLAEGSRLLNDVDVWVPPEHVDQTCAILRQHGFMQSGLDLTAPGKHRERAVARTYLKREPGALRGLAVDVHHALFRKTDGFSLDACACTAAGEVVTLDDVAVTVFRAEDCFVLLAGHLVRDGVLRLQKVLDLRALLSEASAVDYAHLEARAEEARAAAATALALRWARAFGATVPEASIRRLEMRAPPARRAAAMLVDARAISSRFRARVVPLRAVLASHTGKGGLGRSWVAAAMDVLDADRYRRRVGLSTAYRMLRALPVACLAQFAAARSAARETAGNIAGSEWVNGFLWRPECEAGVDVEQ